MRLEELERVFGGSIRVVSDGRHLDTQFGGLRTSIARLTNGGKVTFNIAVVTSWALDPNFARDGYWVLPENVLPRLEGGFMFAGCWRGILLAVHPGEPSLDCLVTALWDLVRCAREPWRPSDYAAEPSTPRARAGVRRERWMRLAWVALMVIFFLWLRAGVTLWDSFSVCPPVLQTI